MLNNPVLLIHSLHTCLNIVFFTLQIVDGLCVVNDHAERAVKLIQDYNQILTKDETSYQNLLLTVSDHRKSTPDLTKSTMAKKFAPK